MSDQSKSVAYATVSVPAAIDHAFAVFTDGLGSWWPREFTWSQDVLDAVGMQCNEGGLCFELGPHGFRIDWGRVLAWQPPNRVVLSWQITPERVPEPNPAKAGQVDVSFVERGPEATEVHVTHSHFERHGDAGEGYRVAMAKQGWPHILDRYAAALS